VNLPNATRPLNSASLCLVAGLLPASLGASTLEGTWLTPPDRNGITAHIEARPCGAALCGTIARTFDPAGREVRTPNLGRTVFWDMKPTGAGTYEGRAYVPAHDRNYDGVISLAGNRAEVSGCLGPVCMGQTWQRVR